MGARFEEFRDENGCCRNLIGGQWVQARETQAVSSPIDGKAIGCIPKMSGEEGAAAVEAARDARANWSARTVHERAELLHRTAAVLERREDELAELLTLEIAKDRKSARSEVQRTADLLRYTADAARGMEGIASNGGSFPGGGRNKLVYTARVPLGTVLAIAPFNYPVNLSASKLAPALVGGNTVVLKPPSQGAMSALALAAAFYEAGLPAGVLNTVTGPGEAVGDALVRHPEIHFINFTGSTAVGRRIAESAGMVPLLLELGGKDAALVLEDADLAFTAKAAVAGAFSYSGQRCTAVKRILAVEPAADRLIELLAAEVDKLKAGDPREEGVTIVPLINDRSADYVQELIDDSVRLGARVVRGNRRDGRLMAPTLLDGVTPEMRIAWEEPFGPVLPVLRVRDADEAVALANRSEYGLQSSVFTKDINRAFSVANRLEVGTVQINNKTERGPDHFPFLGVKSSGMGTQGVRYSIEAMTRPKAVVINLPEGEA